MEIYIEKDGEFYDYSGMDRYIDFNSALLPCAFSSVRKAQKRDFEIGARVYFEGIGWTEVVEQRGCNTGTICALELKGRCATILCNSGARADKKPVVLKLLEEKQEEKTKYVDGFKSDPAYSETITDGLKHDKGKIRMELLPVESLSAIAEVMTFGAEKYAAESWKNVSADRYTGAMLRHYVAYRTGETLDKDSGLSHVAHMATNALFILYLELEKMKKEEVK